MTSRYDENLVVPPLLTAGARVALVAPAGPLRGRDEYDRARQNVRSFGWEPVEGRHALARAGYFAGGDAERLADLNSALRDTNIDAIWFLRGGYGSMRLLDSIDYDAFARNRQALIGYSDVTALHSAFAVRCGAVTFHGPTARAPLSPFSRESLVRAVSAGADSLGAAAGARVLRPGVAAGPLAGGNLALLASLCGTPYAQSFAGAILILEDVNEPVYRVDRMLRQLLLSGALESCSAIAFGHCSTCPEDAGDGARTLDDVLLEVATLVDAPCVAGIPVGHIVDQWTVPLGRMATLDASGTVPALFADNSRSP